MGLALQSRPLKTSRTQASAIRPSHSEQWCATMTRSYTIRCIFILLFPLVILPPMALAQSREDTIVQTATSVLDEIMAIPARRIPTRLLARAHGVAIIPGVVKGGFVVGVRHGRGVVVIRGEDGTWQAPAFVSITGGSVGWQAGLQSTDVILVFGTRKSINNLMNGKLTIGVDAAAAAGPVGRQAAAATDGRLSAEILSYSRSRGLFAGVSFDGSVLQIDQLAAMNFYRTAGPNQPAVIPASATNLVNRLTQYSRAQQAAAAAQACRPRRQPTAQVPPTSQAFATAQTQPNVAQSVQGQPNVQPQANALVPPSGYSPPPTVRPAEPAEMVRLQLSRSWQQLSSLLDANWKTFLAPPEGVLKKGADVDVEVLTETLQRYAAVAGKPQFAALAKRHEFVTTHQLLREYVTLKSASASRALVLPPPPSETPASTAGRY